MCKKGRMFTSNVQARVYVMCKQYAWTS